jgi:hypothetical protein
MLMNIMTTIQTKLLSLAATISALSAQGLVVVPAAHTTNDALAYEWIAGATNEQRQQTLIGDSHLPSITMLNRPITAIELRRSAVSEAFLGGSMDLTVTLSTSPNSALTPSNLFAANVGSNAVMVFQGTVTVPASPATAPAQTAVAWTPNNIVRIAFTTPFVYPGGTLCIDITGTPITGQETWWMADAAEEVIPGTAAVETAISAGCGIYGGPLKQWSEVHARSLVPGGQGVFRAQGTPFGVGLAMFGFPGTSPFPLGSLAQQGCTLGLDVGSPITILPAMFEPEIDQLLVGQATAEILIGIPASTTLFGAGMATQWFDWPQLVTSNTIRWTIGGAIPTLDMALVEGHPLGATGTVTNYLAHVVRLEVQ